MVGYEKSYLFGIILGGGKIVNNRLIITFPFRRWGNYMTNPDKAGQISQDLIEFLRPKFRANFSCDFSFEVAENEWKIFIDNYDNIRNDLISYGVNLIGKFVKNVSINGLANQMTNREKKYFIAGLADVAGSVNPQHRRFNDNYQIISIEIPGFNYELIKDICCIFHDLEFPVDQILWNHPNMHSGHNPIYMNWKKGNKIRVLANEFIDQLTFGFRSKTISAEENVRVMVDEGVSNPSLCPEKFQEQFRLKEKSLHLDENSELLPESIINSHYIHMGHICCAIKCPYAPYQLIREKIQSSEIGHYFSYFPVILKGSTNEIQYYINNSILIDEEFTESEYKFIEIKNLYNNSEFLHLTENNTDYSLNRIIQGAIYLIQIKNGILSGSQQRIKGSISEFLDNSSQYNEEIFSLKIPRHKTPLILTLDDHSVLIGPDIRFLYRNLIVFNNETYSLNFRDLSLDDFSP
ncbi:MAG: hypothetical protein ACTSPD_21445 [Promethearchaeota archaeon]